MSELYERVTGEIEPRLPVHSLQAMLGSWARGEATGAQASAWIESALGEPPSGVLTQEAQDLVATVTAIAVPAAPAALANNAAANALRDYALAWGQRTQGLANRAAQMNKIDRALLLAEKRIPPCQDAVAVRAFLGVPTR